MLMAQVFVLYLAFGDIKLICFSDSKVRGRRSTAFTTAVGLGIINHLLQYHLLGIKFMRNTLELKIFGGQSSTTLL